jgi:hypothetical protein
MKKILVIGLLAVLVLSVMASGMVRKFTMDGECGGRNVSSVCQDCGTSNTVFYWQPLPPGVMTGSLDVGDPTNGTEVDTDDLNDHTNYVTQAEESGYTGGGGGPSAACW